MYLDSTEDVPGDDVDRINVRDNLKLAQVTTKLLLLLLLLLMLMLLLLMLILLLPLMLILILLLLLMMVWSKRGNMNTAALVTIAQCNTLVARCSRQLIG